MSLLAAALTLAACPALDADAALEEMMAADRAFAALALEVGEPEAFRAYAAEDARLLVGGPAEPVGPAAIAAARPANREGVLRWAPRGGYASASGDFGATYGDWFIAEEGDETGAAARLTGDYLSVWRREPDCSWRYVIDTGTVDPRPGPGQ